VEVATGVFQLGVGEVSPLGQQLVHRGEILGVFALSSTISHSASNSAAASGVRHARMACKSGGGGTDSWSDGSAAAGEAMRTPLINQPCARSWMRSMVAGVFFGDVGERKGAYSRLGSIVAPYPSSIRSLIQNSGP